MSNASLEALVGGMSVRDLASHAGISVEEVISRVMGSGSAKPARTKPKPVSAKSTSGSKPPKSSTPSVNTRTPGGRATYQAAILKVLEAAKGDKLGAAQIRAQVGGTGLQARTALNVLIEAKKVKYEGKARATRYWAK